MGVLLAVVVTRTVTLFEVAELAMTEDVGFFFQFQKIQEE